MDAETNLEDGEILEPHVISSNSNNFTQSRVTREPQTICSEESSNDNSEHSDEDSDAQCSRAKKLKPERELPIVKKNDVPNKYKVWSLALQEEVLMDTLTKCDVESINRDRSVESYNYKQAENTDFSQFSGYHMPVSECHYLESDYVRCNDEKKFVVGSKRRRHSKKKHKHKRDEFQVRNLPYLTVTYENSAEEIAEDIALNLHERKVDLILNVVLVLGKERAIALYNETKGVEDNGGMLLMDQVSRRTSGGIYFLLIKRDNTIPSEKIKQIFASDSCVGRSEKKQRAKKRRKKSLEDYKETLIREKLLCLNTTTSVQDSDLKPLEGSLDSESHNLEEGEVTVTNPPPSPATDQDTSPSRVATALSDEDSAAPPADGVRTIVSYDDDDDFLEVDTVDDIDMF